jgi:hypothetical protein
MAAIPALTMREIRIGIRDQDNGRHWHWRECWCKRSHDGTETGLTIVAPPWDVTRDGEKTR